MKGRDKRRRAKLKPKNLTRERINQIAKQLIEWSKDGSHTVCIKK